MKMKALSAALAAAGVLAAGTAGAIDLPHWLKPEPKASAVQATPTTKTANASEPAAVPMLPASSVPDYRAIVKQASPAVVGVTVSGMHKTSGGMQGLPPGMENDPFFKFFRGMPGFQLRGEQGGEMPFKGLGSGFIISSDGLILTNAHVVRDAKEVTVKLKDRREFSAKVLGSDPTTDIAVLQIEATGLPTVRLGDARTLQVGDPVLAIGAPYGLEETATQGIVSAKGRALPGDTVVPFIQTDAAVNPGNSGGPLFNGNGAVVGINAQIYSRSGGYQGLSFAIPINVALNVKDQILENGKVAHARLGVTIQDVNQALANSFGLERPHGALVSSVAPDSAAAAAGLKAGDVITKVDGEPVTQAATLSSVIGMSAPGAKVDLTVWRNRKSIEVAAKLGSVDASDVQVADSDGNVHSGHIGLALRPLTPDERKQASVEQGLLVENVAGPAAKAGIRPGDVLLAINGRTVESVDEVKSVLAKKPKSVALLVERGGDKIFVPVNLG
jgi:serine protease Do